MTTTRSKRLAIRPVGDDVDRNTAITLARTIWFEHYPGIISFAQIHYMLERGYRPEVIAEEQRAGIEWHVASLDATPVGFVAFGPSGRDMKVHKAYVLEAARGAGVGRGLMARARDAAIASGCDGLVLTVNRGNLDSVRAYLAIGYSFAARVCMPIGHGFYMDDYVMRLPLPR